MSRLINTSPLHARRAVLRGLNPDITSKVSA